MVFAVPLLFVCFNPTVSSNLCSTMKIAWGKKSKVKKQSVVVSTIPGLPFGAGSDNDEVEREEKSDANTNCPGTKPVETAELLQSQGDKLAEVSLFI